VEESEKGGDLDPEKSGISLQSRPPRFDFKGWNGGRPEANPGRPSAYPKSALAHRSLGIGIARVENGDPGGRDCRTPSGVGPSCLMMPRVITIWELLLLPNRNGLERMHRRVRRAVAPQSMIWRKAHASLAQAHCNEPANKDQARRNWPNWKKSNLGVAQKRGRGRAMNLVEPPEGPMTYHQLRAIRRGPRIARKALGRALTHCSHH